MPQRKQSRALCNVYESRKAEITEVFFLPKSSQTVSNYPDHPCESLKPSPHTPPKPILLIQLKSDIVFTSGVVINSLFLFLLLLILGASEVVMED